MPRYVLVDAELNVIAGDTQGFYTRFLRTVAFARGEVATAEAIERLTPSIAAQVMDIIEGDNIGWRYVVHDANWPEGRAGYEVFEVPLGTGDRVPLVSRTEDPGVVQRVRVFFRRVAFVEKVMPGIEPVPAEPPEKVTERRIDPPGWVPGVIAA